MKKPLLFLIGATLLTAACGPKADDQATVFQENQ